MSLHDSPIAGDGASTLHSRPLFSTRPQNQQMVRRTEKPVTTASSSETEPVPVATTRYKWMNITATAPAAVATSPPSLSSCPPSQTSTHANTPTEDDPITTTTTTTTTTTATARPLLRHDELQDSDFRRESFLGEGSYAIVTLATHLPSGRLFALKEIMCTRLRAMQLTDQLQWEINVHRRLRHVNIVRLYSYYYNPEDDGIRLVLEYCPRGTLQQYVRRAPHGRLDEARASRLVRHMARAVAYMHSHKLVHRDLKLENVLLDHRYVAKLADFGWSRQLAFTAPTAHKRNRDDDGDDTEHERVALLTTVMETPQRAGRPSGDKNGERGAPLALAAAASSSLPESLCTPDAPSRRCAHTTTTTTTTPATAGSDGDDGGATVGRRTVCGTLDYLSPEMVSHRPHTRKTDVWSLGVMVAEMLTGHTPFYRPSPQDTLEAIRSAAPDLSVPATLDDLMDATLTPPPPPPPLSADAVSLVHAMLDKDPARRPTMEEVLAHPWLQKRTA